MPLCHAGRLIILSGPSCVGKTPLAHAVTRLYPELAGRLLPLIRYNSREPRPGEIDGKDYLFRPRGEVEKLGENPHFILTDVRGDLQAFDVMELKTRLASADCFYEGNPFFGIELLRHRKLFGIPKMSVFMSPLSRSEILQLQHASSPERIRHELRDLMYNKLERRTLNQWGNLTAERKKAIKLRADSAFRELCDAHWFDFVIVNHDGEDSDNWRAFEHPVGDAGQALRMFAALLRGEIPPGVEKWEPGLLGRPQS